MATDDGAGDAYWPDGPLLAYCGDDFTGSTDVLEAFTAAGVPTVLFLQPPDAHWRERFADQRCIGLATTARSRSPQWMDSELASAFAALKEFGAPLLQYKVCSTFDSSPAIGSIGRAIDLGCALMPGHWSPMVVGAPRLRRYQAFGNLFATADGAVHRLDRHPTMSHHPVTPMREADLRQHLAQQTARRIELIDLLELRSGRADERCAALAGADRPVVLFDVIDDHALAEIGRLVWQRRGRGIFSASSSGLEYALAAHWRELGLLPQQPSLPTARPAEAIAAVSGSCSPATAAQIGWAAQHGFHTERLAIGALLDPHGCEPEIERAVGAAAVALCDGRSPLVYSARGPADPAVSGFNAAAADAGMARGDASARIGDALAEVMRRLLERMPALSRVVVAGGDSSGAVAGSLGIAALTVRAGLTPGAPLCRAWSTDARRDGLELVLKGGQMGSDSFFGAVLEGREPR